MSTPLMPESISFAQVVAAVRSLGIDPAQVADMDMDLRKVHVTVYKLDETGNRYFEPGSAMIVAKETLTIPIIGGPEA